MNIKSAQYFEDAFGLRTIRATIDGELLSVPLDPNNRHYAALLAWAEKDGNEIQAAE
mgnify:FL=1|jgi:hypothetical protein